MIRVRNKAVEPSKRLWAMANWSRFVRPGAVRVSASGSGAKVSAFKNVDGVVAVQVLNSGSAKTVTISVSGGSFTAGSAAGWVTDSTRDCTQIAATVDGGKVSGSVPASSMVTFVLKPGAAAAPARYK